MSLHSRDVEQDVRELSTLLGDVLADRVSPEALETVERVRTGALAYRRGDADSREELRAATASRHGHGSTTTSTGATRTSTR